MTPEIYQLAPPESTLQDFLAEQAELLDSGEDCALGSIEDFERSRKRSIDFVRERYYGY